MKKLLFSLIVATLAVLSTTASEADWLTDLPKALEKAKTEKKFVLIDFTGSDWCPPCIKLHKEVLSTKEFETYAAKDFVLVMLDYPTRKPQPPELKKANEALQAKYKIEGFPTLIVLNSEGKELGRDVGYGGGGLKGVTAKLNAFKSK